MSQHDLDISVADANTGTTFRAAINLALKALGSSQSGDSAPTTTYPGMMWYDTLNSKLKVRNAGNDAWLELWDFSSGFSAFAYTLVDDTTAAAALETLTALSKTLANIYAAASGTDTYTAGLTPAMAAYATNAIYFMKFANANTVTAPTLNIDAKGAKTIKKGNGTALSAGDITNNYYALLTYDGTDLILLNPVAQAHSGRHASGSSDPIKLDDLAAPDDNTDLNVSSSAHGLCPKHPNDATQHLRGAGTWGTDYANAADAGAIVLASADTERLDNRDLVYTKIKEIQVYRAGTVRASVDAKCHTDSGRDFYIRFLVNGAPVGSPQTVTLNTYASFTQDVSVGPGDLVSLQYYVQNADGNWSADIKNFRLLVAPAYYPGWQATMD